MPARYRVIIDNDFAGDPDDLFQLVHHLLSPSVTIPFLVSSHLGPGDLQDPSDKQAAHGVAIAERALELMGMAGDPKVLCGSETGLVDPATPIDNEAVQAIIAEAMREGTDMPLYIALGGGLTDIASALLLEPRIADRATAVWIGGPEHAGYAVTPDDADAVEYNLNIDIAAAQAVFNRTAIQIWQVPRNVYRQCLVSRAELELRVRPMGAIGGLLADSVDRQVDLMAQRIGWNLGETYALGDSPLVLLTALQSAFQPDPSSSPSTIVPTPHLNAKGQYQPNPQGRPLRLFTGVDTRLMFEDFFVKLAAFASS